jgi:hypothetical protein
MDDDAVSGELWNKLFLLEKRLALFLDVRMDRKKVEQLTHASISYLRT